MHLPGGGEEDMWACHWPTVWDLFCLQPLHDFCGLSGHSGWPAGKVWVNVHFYFSIFHHFLNLLFLKKNHFPVIQHCLPAGAIQSVLNTVFSSNSQCCVVFEWINADTVVQKCICWLCVAATWNHCSSLQVWFDTFLVDFNVSCSANVKCHSCELEIYKYDWTVLSDRFVLCY